MPRSMVRARLTTHDFATVKKNPPMPKDGAPVTVNGKVLTVKEKALMNSARVAPAVRAGMEMLKRGPHRGWSLCLTGHSEQFYAETPTGTLATWSTSDPYSHQRFRTTPEKLR